MCIEIKENITWLESYSSLDILSSVNPSFLNVINSCVLYHVTISTHNAMDVLRSLCLSVSLATCVMTDVRTVLSIPFSFLFCVNWSMEKRGKCTRDPLVSQGHILTTAVCLVYVVSSNSPRYMALYDSLMNLQRGNGNNGERFSDTLEIFYSIPIIDVKCTRPVNSLDSPYEFDVFSFILSIDIAVLHRRHQNYV